MAPLVVVHFEVVCLGRKTSPNFPDVPLRVYHLSLSGRQRGHARLGLLRASRIFGSRKNARKVGGAVRRAAVLAIGGADGSFCCYKLDALVLAGRRSLSLVQWSRSRLWARPLHVAGQAGDQQHQLPAACAKQA